jgi:hypothetical protein
MQLVSNQLVSNLDSNRSGREWMPKGRFDQHLMHKDEKPDWHAEWQKSGFD